MNADRISEIVQTVEISPYRCILIDGKWGIGKTYEICKGKAHLNSSAMVSLFGVNNEKELFKQLFWKLNSDGKEMSAAFNSVVNIGKGIASHYGFEKIVDPILSALPKEKELVESYINKITQTTVFIFDDIERISPQFQLRDFLGIIENLLQNDKVRVILVANSEEFDNPQRLEYERYKEKVINKIYHVDSFSCEVDWKRFGVDEAFAKSFIKDHGLTNLRTIKKANQFYLDVKGQIQFDISEAFDEALRYVCFAIVTESVDEIYLRKLRDEISCNNDNSYVLAHKKMLLKKSAYRISASYLSKINIGMELPEKLYEYYLNAEDIDHECLKSSMTILENAGEKHNFYKSDDELKQMLATLKPLFYESTSVAAMLDKANVICIWMRILKMDIDAFLMDAEKLIKKQIKSEIERKENIDFSHALFHLESKELKEVVDRISHEYPNMILENCISNLKYDIGEKNYESAIEYIRILDNNMYRIKKGNFLNDKLKTLLNEDFLPLGSIEPTHWDCFRQFIVLANPFIPEDVDIYFESSKEKYSYDNAFIHRIETLQEQI